MLHSVLFTPWQLAERWQTSAKTLERWRMKGIGPAYLKIGKRVLYPLEEIEAHERRRTRAATSRSLIADAGRAEGFDEHEAA